MVHFWVIFCRSILEQSCVLWDSSLSQENIDNLERTQKSFAKLVLQSEYKSYPEAIFSLNLDNLQTRRKKLKIKFGNAGIQNNTLTDLFPLKNKKHNMTTRCQEKYEITHSNTKRLKNSTILNLQSLMNKEEEKKKKSYTSG